MNCRTCKHSYIKSSGICQTETKITIMVKQLKGARKPGVSTTTIVRFLSVITSLRITRNFVYVSSSISKHWTLVFVEFTTTTVTKWMVQLDTHYLVDTVDMSRKPLHLGPSRLLRTTSVPFPLWNRTTAARDRHEGILIQVWMWKPCTKCFVTSTRMARLLKDTNIGKYSEKTLI